MIYDRGWKKITLSNKFISESCCFIYPNNDETIIGIVAGQWIWTLDGRKKKIRDIEDSWLPPWPYNNKEDIHAKLRKGGGPPQYKADTYDFVVDLSGNGYQDIITVGMHKDPICWYENPGKSDQKWDKHIITSGGIYESVCFGDLFGTGKQQLITIPQKPHIAWYEPQQDIRLLWNKYIISELDGDWHGLGIADVNNDGCMEVLTKNNIYSLNLDRSKPWKRNNVLVIDENENVSEGFGDVFSLQAVHWQAKSKYPVIFSTCPHGFGFYYWVLEEMKSQCFVYRRYKICDTVSQLHNLKIIVFNNEIYVITGKRYWAHGKDGDIDANGKAYLLCYKIDCDGKGCCYIIDDNSGAGICSDVIVYGNKLYLATSNKKGLFLFIKE